MMFISAGFWDILSVKVLPQSAIAEVLHFAAIKHFIYLNKTVNRYSVIRHCP